jgi:hypothetical protein
MVGEREVSEAQFLTALGERDQDRAWEVGSRSPSG